MVSLIDIIRSDKSKTTFTDEFMPDIYRFSCKMFQEFASLSDERTGADRDEWLKALMPALEALEVLGSFRMQRYIGRYKDGPLVSLILEQWPKLFLGMNVLFAAMRTRDSKHQSNMTQAVVTHFSDVIIAVLQNSNIQSLLVKDTDLQKFAWALWLSGGVPDSDDLDINWVSTVIAILRLSIEGHGDDSSTASSTMFPVCMAVCNQYGGKDAVAEIALMSAYRTMMSDSKGPQNLMVVLAQQVSMLMILTNPEDDPTQQIPKRICELDGIAKLIEGFLKVFTESRDEVCQTELGPIVGSLITVIDRLATDNYNRIKQAARSGLLGIILALNPDKGDLPDEIRDPCILLLNKIPYFFSCYSVTETFAEQIRNVTDEAEAGIKDSEGTLGYLWRVMKGRLLEFYVLNRLFDTFAESFPKCCNNVSVVHWHASLAFYVALFTPC